MTKSLRPRIAAIGEILWDLFPDGPRFGGAPANFACHAAALHADVSMVSGVGLDELGQQARQALTSHGVRIDHVQVSANLPTGRVQVSVSESGLPSYEFNNQEAWDDLDWTTQLGELATNVEAICFGTLGQRKSESHNTVNRFLKLAPTACLKVLDINLRSPFWSASIIESSLQQANVLKLNDEELKTIAEIYSLSGTESQLLQQLQDQFGIQLIVLTRGENGSLLSGENKSSELPAHPTNVVDTVGCGDAFTAAVVTGLLRGMELSTLHQLASEVAAFVGSQPGATPTLPDDLVARCAH